MNLKFALLSIVDATRHIFRLATESIALDLCQSTSDRPLLGGSELAGDYNFRVRNMDSAADPYGWYEDDL